MIEFKPGVSVDGIAPEMLVALLLADQVFSGEGIPCVVTSVTDGTHKTTSLHYVGLAMDFRCKHVHPSALPRLVARLRDVLHPLGFEVLHEASGEPNEHVHIEHDPGHTNR